jgi:hypothetical protein
MLKPPPETPYNFLSLGAGVQSSCMALMAKHGEITPMPDAAIFADTGDEPRAVYEWLSWLESELPYPVHKVKKGEKALSETEVTMRISGKTGKPYWRRLIPHFGMVEGKPGMFGGRKCTAEFKIVPINRKAKEIASIKRAQKEITVTQYIGISLDEVTRMKDSRDAWCQHRWPLVELGMRRDDCRRWMADNGYPAPPRSACLFCPFHSDEEWRTLKEGDPDEWQSILDFEHALQEIAATGARDCAVPYLHRTCTPLNEVDLRSDTDKGQMLLWQNECEGMCGI